jgi:hypothetical protein
MTQDHRFIVARQRLTDRRAMTQNLTYFGTQKEPFLPARRARARNIRAPLLRAPILGNSWAILGSSWVIF